MNWNYPPQFIRDHQVCKCGDFRHQHEDGENRCRVCQWHNPQLQYYPARPCPKFRLSHDANEGELARQWELQMRHDMRSAEQRVTGLALQETKRPFYGPGD